jgi:transcriptional regulator with XRE-family HTH domain
MEQKENVKATIAKNITKIRTAKGYSKRQLARLVNMDEKQIRRLEGAEDYDHMPSIPVLIEVANVLEVPLLTFFI